VAEPGDVERALGVSFEDRELLELALTHRSYAFEAGGLPTNERLEFLGDAVLGFVVTARLYRDHPAEAEGRLAKLRAATVNARTLARVARELGLGGYVRLGRGEEQSGGQDKDSILADTLEALIGAVYLDGGMSAAADVVLRLLGDVLEDLARDGETFDSKTTLQELTAARIGELPVYEVTEEGPDHAKRFSALVSVAGEIVGRGEGRSKKEAEQQAAAEALTHLPDAVSSRET
jgi:ribonuclease III